MTLSFEEKKAIFDDYEELTAVPVSMNRINYHFNASAVDHKIVVRFLHPNGNAFIYAGYLPKEETDKGYISVLESDEGTIRFLLEKAISFLKKTVDGLVAQTGSFIERLFRLGKFSITKGIALISTTTVI